MLFFSQPINHKVFLLKNWQTVFHRQAIWPPGGISSNIFFKFNVGQWRDISVLMKLSIRFVNDVLNGLNGGQSIILLKYKLNPNAMIYKQTIPRFPLQFDSLWKISPSWFLFWTVFPYASGDDRCCCSGSRPRSALPSNLSMTRSIIQIDYSLKFLL